MHQWVRSFVERQVESIQGWIMLHVLQPAADNLPRNCSRALAYATGLLMALSPTRGRTAYLTMRKVFGRSVVRGFTEARQLVTQPLLDFVILRRIIRGHEDWTRWDVVETGSVEARQIRDSGDSFILGTGHFARESSFAFLLPQILPHRIGVVAAPMPPPSADPLQTRVRLQYRQIIDAMQCMRPDDLQCLSTGGSSLGFARYLAQPRSVIIIMVDAYWLGGGHYGPDRVVPNNIHLRGALQPPFAGLRSYRIATGTASLARIVQCPILPSVTYIKGTTIVVNWGAPILPPLRTDKDADIRITEQLLHHMELAIGARPTQYTLNIGCERRWNAVNRKWEDHSQLNPDKFQIGTVNG